MVLLALFSAPRLDARRPSILRMQATAADEASSPSRLEFARAALADVNELPPPPLPELKASLLARAADADRGFKTTDAERDVLRTLAAQLEASFDGAAEAPTSSPQLLGAWSLVFTDASDVLALGALPATLGDITQTVARAEDGDGGADFVADNAVELEPPSAPLFGAIGALAGLRPATQYSVRARCRVLDEKRLSLLFVGGSVRSELALLRLGRTAAPPPLAGTFLPPPLAERVEELLDGRVFLETTYLDDTLRVARGPGRELWVLCKKDE